MLGPKAEGALFTTTSRRSYVYGLTQKKTEAEKEDGLLEAQFWGQNMFVKMARQATGVNWNRKIWPAVGLDAL